jgi:hypothetical protein
MRTEHVQVKLVRDVKTGKSRGYAFVEFVHERDMRGKSPSVCLDDARSWPCRRLNLR